MQAKNNSYTHSPNKQKLQSQPQQNTNTSHLYFYNNAIFMGTTKSLQRIGTGIILFNTNNNNQAQKCAIVSYSQNSQLSGHSIFYSERSLTSCQFLRNRLVNVVYRIDGYMLYLEYNDKSKIHGDCYLFNFIQRNLYKIVYEDGYIKGKIKIDVVDKVNIKVQNLFAQDNYQHVIGKKHHRAIRNEISAQDISRIRMNKIGNKVQVVYMANNHHTGNGHEKLVNGLGFQFIFRNPQKGGYNTQTNRYKDQFQLKIVQKGLYQDNLLQGYGLRIFKNNNIYEGYFKNNAFHEQGCLRNTQKGSWIYGQFANGQMYELLDFSNQSNEIARCKILLQNLRQSQRDFINEMIQQNSFQFLDVELQKISSKNQIDQLKSQTFRDRKLQLMKKITAQFTQLQNINSPQRNNTKMRNSQLTPNKNLKDSSNRNNGVQTQRKSQHSIKSLLPQSIKISDFYLAEDKADIYKQIQNNIQESRSIQKRMTLSQNLQNMSLTRDPNKKYSKIFHKTYTHLQEKQKNFMNQTQFVRLNQIKSNRQRKSFIFSNTKKQKLLQSPSVMRLNSPSLTAGQNLSPYRNQSRLSKSPYQRRSPARKTAIFQSNTKLKRNTNLSNTYKQASTPNKLDSIRKSAVDKQKKILNKSRVRKSNNSPIFDENKSKQIEASTKFNYTIYENANQKQKNKKIADSPTLSLKYAKNS